MKERISRHNDERIYQPRIHARLIRELYRLKIETGLPMTVILEKAICEFVSEYEVQYSSRNTTGEDKSPVDR